MSQAQDKLALQKSQAGMRFIAQTTIYNRQDLARLRQFIAESYSEVLLAEQDMDARLMALQAWYAQEGRVRVKQVLAANEHHVIVALETEKSANLYYLELKCEDDYPHKVTLFMLAPLKTIEE
jgi:hypothetical protein